MTDGESRAIFNTDNTDSSYRLLSILHKRKRYARTAKGEEDEAWNQELYLSDGCRSTDGGTVHGLHIEHVFGGAASPKDHRACRGAIPGGRGASTRDWKCIPSTTNMINSNMLSLNLRRSDFSMFLSTTKHILGGACTPYLPWPRKAGCLIG